MVSEQLYGGMAFTIFGLLVMIFSKWISTHVPLSIQGMPVKSKKTGRHSATILSKQGLQTSNEFFGKGRGSKVLLVIGGIFLLVGIVFLILEFTG